MAAMNESTDFYVSGPTTLDALIPEETTQNVRDGVCILLVLAGRARVAIDGTGYGLSRGHVVLLFPHHTAATEWQSADFSCEFLCFEFDFMADFPLLLPPEEAERFGESPCCRTEEDGFAALRRSYDAIAAYDALREHPARTGIVKAQLFVFVAELLFRCANRTEERRMRRGEMLTNDFFHLLHRYYGEERTLAFYADRLCVTTKYLSRVVRRTTGQTVCFWIETFTVREAKRLLRSTQATVAEIAERLHFSDSSFFAKFFRRNTGLSPVEFRRRER